MNTAEVISRISKKAGIPETETKKFFEIFLKQTSGILNPGESVKIPGVGLFQLRVGQIEKFSEKTKKEFIYSNLIVFMGGDGQETEEVIFNVPPDFEKEYHSLDSYFSLSLGKPIIPLKGVKAAEFFIPPSGPELRGLFESKVNRLLEEAEKTTGGKETEIILLKSEKGSVDVEPVEEELPVHSDFLKTREFENLSWDFGENLSEEIDTEASVEFNKEFKESEKIPVREADIPDFEEEDFTPENADEELFEEAIQEETEWMEPEEESEVVSDEPEVGLEDKLESKPEGKPEGKPESEVIPEKIVDEVSEVESESALTDSDFNESGDSEKEEEIGEPETEIIRDKEDKHQLSLKNFQRVSSLTKEFNISVSEGSEDKTEPEKSHPRITEVRGGFQKVRRTTAEFNFDFSGMKGLDEEGDSDKNEIREAIDDGYKGYRKSAIPTIIIIGFVIIALAALIYFYLNLKNENSNGGTSKPQTKVIERNYDVPVTYPDNSTEVKTNDNKNENQVKNVNTPGEVNSGESEITEPVNAERIENYIYQYPQGIVVQVSSWKSKSVAVGEVKKFRNAGYKAFAEMSTIPGMGIYYRVRVGYFNSLNEAKEFANGNQ